MTTLSERIVAALGANKGVLLPAIQSLMEEAWNEGADAAWENSGEGWNGEYPGHAFEKDGNPYVRVPPVPKTSEEIAAFAKRWDERVEAGWAVRDARYKSKVLGVWADHLIDSMD